jgi:hypothetical protein
VPRIIADVEYTNRKKRKAETKNKKWSGYSLKEIENYGELSGPDFHYSSIEVKDTGPIVLHGLQNHNYNLVKEKRIQENTDYMEMTKIGIEKLSKEHRLYDEPQDRRFYEMPMGMWPRPKEKTYVNKKLGDSTYRPPSPLEEMTPYPNYEKFKSKTTNYLSEPYNLTAQTNYLTGATSRHMLNNAKYDRAPGYHVPEQYEHSEVKKKLDKRDIYFVDTRRYLPAMDSMNPVTNATPYSRKSILPDSRRSIPSTARKTFNMP